MAAERLPWLDPVLAAALTIAGIAMTLDPSDGAMIDSLVVGAVTLPVIWRRRAALPAAVAVSAGMVLSGIPTFDQTRCGVAIPAALLIGFSVAVRHERREALTGLALVVSGLVFLLFTDPLLGAGAAFVLPLAAGVWGAGRLTRSRGKVAAELAERSRRLADAREETAQLAVEVERLRLGADLDAAARARITGLLAFADRTRAALDGDRQASPDAFAAIERDARESLNQMRELLGRLRSDERAPSPQPTLVQIESLLDRARPGGCVIALEVDGERRRLPTAVELTAYRVVQHGLDALDDSDTPACVRLRYLPDALELEIRGSVSQTPPAQAALAAARERTAAHGGEFASAPAPDGRQVTRARLQIAVPG